MKNTNKSLTDCFYTIANLMDAVGPEGSLGKDAWKEIAILDLHSLEGIKILIEKYVLPEYFGCHDVYQSQCLKCIQELLRQPDELEKFPMDEYPFLEEIPPHLFFSTLIEGIRAREKIYNDPQTPLAFTFD